MKKNDINYTTINVSGINKILSLEGTELLEQTCILLQEKLHSFCTCIVELNETNRTATTLAYVQEGHLMDELEYDIQNTPCEQAQKSAPVVLACSQRVF